MQISDELREVVARALATKDLACGDAAGVVKTVVDMRWKEYVPAARAAISAALPMIRDAVLEEAAKVTENAFTQECCGLGVGSPMECCADLICVALAPHEIATTIRAMKGTSHE